MVAPLGFLAGANAMGSIGSLAGSAAGLGSMATAFMPTIANAATSFAPAALSGGLGIGSAGLAQGFAGGNGLGIGALSGGSGFGQGSLIASEGLQGLGAGTGALLDDPWANAAFMKSGNIVEPWLNKALNEGLAGEAAGAVGEGVGAVGEGVGAAKGAAKASKGFLGMNPEQQAFWEFMAGDVIAPLAKQIAAGQVEEEKDDEGHVTGYKYNDLGRALAAVGDLSSSFTLGSQTFNKLMSLKAPGGSTAGTPKKPGGDKKKTPKEGNQDVSSQGLLNIFQA